MFPYVGDKTAWKDETNKKCGSYYRVVYFRVYLDHDYCDSKNILFISVIPIIAVIIRRLHDANNSGWGLIILFFPIGIIFLIIVLYLNGNKEANRFGSNPKEASD